MAVKDLSTLADLVEAYRGHQRSTRGLRGTTVQRYEETVRAFVRPALGADPIDPNQLRPSDVLEFFGSMRDRFSPRTMKTAGAALRSFFRFLRFHGLCGEELEASIPTTAAWRLSALPRCLSDRQIEQVLASLDGSRSCASRDRAIVLCLVTLGLRPGELADLRLEDIDWRAGTLHLQTRKTRRGAVLPLPQKAGRAIVDYLRGDRPATGERHVFVKHLGVHRGRPITSTAVSAAVVRALRRAGVEPPLVGAYVFRHTVASRMVRRGASLKEVADFLGHRCLDSATVYAKLDLPALRAVPLPWPEVIR